MNFTVQFQLTADTASWKTTAALVGAAVVFATQDEADQYGLYLLASFPGAYACQTITTAGPVNTQFANGAPTRIFPRVVVPFKVSDSPAPAVPPPAVVFHGRKLFNFPGAHRQGRVRRA